MEFRQFFAKGGIQPTATASAMIEIQSVREDGLQRATKLMCSVYGPMQKQNDASVQSN
jgi:hypothetical protein